MCLHPLRRSHNHGSLSLMLFVLLAALAEEGKFDRWNIDLHFIFGPPYVI